MSRHTAGTGHYGLLRHKGCTSASAAAAGNQLQKFDQILECKCTLCTLVTEGLLKSACHTT